MGQVLGGEAQQVTQLTKQRPAVLEAAGRGGRSLEPVQIRQGGANLVEQALFVGRAGRGQAAVAFDGELLAAVIEVQLGQRKRIGEMLAPGAFQEPQQERGQVLAQALGGPRVWRLAGRAGGCAGGCGRVGRATWRGPHPAGARRPRLGNGSGVDFRFISGGRFPNYSGGRLARFLALIRYCPEERAPSSGRSGRDPKELCSSGLLACGHNILISKHF